MGEICGDPSDAMQNFCGVTCRRRFIKPDCLPSASSSSGEKSRSKALENRISCSCFIRFACKGDLFFLVNQLDHE